MAFTFGLMSSVYGHDLGASSSSIILTILSSCFVKSLGYTGINVRVLHRFYSELGFVVTITFCPIFLKYKRNGNKM